MVGTGTRKLRAPAVKKPTAKSAPKGRKATSKKAVEPERLFDPSLKTVTIEACTQSTVFMTRAKKIKSVVGEKANFEINKETPGKGNFVIKISGSDEPIVELRELKRPFDEVKALDIDEISEKILAELGHKGEADGGESEES